MAQRRQAKREVGELLPRLRVGLGVMGQLTEKPSEKFTTEEFDQAFGVVDDVVQRSGRMHRIERPTFASSGIRNAQQYTASRWKLCVSSSSTLPAFRPTPWRKKTRSDDATFDEGWPSLMCAAGGTTSQYRSRHFGPY
ncbi:hypothetical protein FS837_002817 [Tulasnella sp. UAMH 9824]|nr:hypothetical protein FS837_002817 [Tulasnella sp. UAMH 9824]